MPDQRISMLPAVAGAATGAEEVALSVSGVTRKATLSALFGALSAPSAGFVVLGTVADSGSLPAGTTIGDVYIASDTGHGWQWNGTTWVDIGAFNFIEDPAANVAGARTLGTGSQQAAQGARLRDLGINVFDYGAVGDGTTDDTAAIQAAIDAAEAAGGGIVTGWRCHVVTNLTVPSFVTLHQAGSSSDGFAATPDAPGTLIAGASATGYMITIDSGGSTTKNVGIIGMTLVGRGSANVDQSGIRVVKGATNCRILDNMLAEFPMYGIYLESDGTVASGAHHIERNKVAAGYRAAANLGATEHIAAIRVEHTDSYIAGNELLCGITSLDTSLRRKALWLGLRGSYNRMSGNVYELSDIGCLVEGVGNQFAVDRADLNWGHGFFVGRGYATSAGNPRDNTFASCRSLRNSRGTTNTYDSFHTSNANGGVCLGNIFTGCQAHNLASDAWTHRYGFYAGGDSPSTGTAVGNQFIGCSGYGQGTTIRGAASAGRMQWQTGRCGAVAISGGGTPNADDVEFFALTDLVDVGAVYTNFLNGSNGQDLFIYGSTAGGAVLQHGAGVLNLIGAANITMAAKQIVHLKWAPLAPGWVQVS